MVANILLYIGSIITIGWGTRPHYRREGSGKRLRGHFRRQQEIHLNGVGGRGVDTLFYRGAGAVNGHSGRNNEFRCPNCIQDIGRDADCDGDMDGTDRSKNL